MNHKRSRASGLIGIRGVAEVAGVSPMTASRALSRPELVAADTRRKVQEAAKAVGYVPNRLAGALSRHRTHVVGLVIPTLQNLIATETIQGINAVLDARGIHLMIGEYGTSLAKEEELIHAFLAYRPSGLILQSTVHTPAAAEVVRRAGIPVVETGNLIKAPLDSNVSFSNYAAAKAMTEYLIRRYRKVAYVGFAVAENDRTRDRRRGYAAALRAAGRTVDPACMVDVPVRRQVGDRILVELLQAQPDIDAIFFGGHWIAVEALIECYRRGIDVPGRIALAGLDDNDLSEKLPPGLTTVRIPRAEMGRRSAEGLLKRIDDPNAPPFRIDVGFEIVRRGSA
ncbi:MAG: LacI family DNA-binding transcriptional regulator [Proteobacteria bacterium]|nr:LacI family DNA-binding transcriptional regulator [Pseudomonadota bacterium]